MGMFGIVGFHLTLKAKLGKALSNANFYWDPPTKYLTSSASSHNSCGRDTIP